MRNASRSWNSRLTWIRTGSPNRGKRYAYRDHYVFCAAFRSLIHSISCSISHSADVTRTGSVIDFVGVIANFQGVDSIGKDHFLGAHIYIETHYITTSTVRVEQILYILVSISRAPPPCLSR